MLNLHSTDRALDTLLVMTVEDRRRLAELLRDPVAGLPPRTTA